jgi:hypothetical protein
VVAVARVDGEEAEEEDCSMERYEEISELTTVPVAVDVDVATAPVSVDVELALEALVLLLVERTGPPGVMLDAADELAGAEVVEERKVVVVVRPERSVDVVSTVVVLVYDSLGHTGRVKVDVTPSEMLSTSLELCATTPYRKTRAIRKRIFPSLFARY